MEKQNNLTIIEEIMQAEPSVAYMRLQRAIAEAEEKLTTTRGWFWKKPSMSVGDRAEEEAKLKLMRIALQQVINTLAGNETSGISVTVSQKTITL